MRNPKEPVLERLAWVTKNIVLIGSLFLILLGGVLAILTYTVLPKSPSYVIDPLRAIGIGLIGAAITSGLVSFVIARYPKAYQDQIDKFVQEDVMTKLEGLSNDITKRFGELQAEVTTELEGLNNDITKRFGELQTNVRELTEQFVQISQSLLSLQKAGISRVYAHRNEAAEDMLQDIKNPHISKIRFIGISLNDFIRHENTNLHQIWQVIEEYVVNPSNAPSLTSPQLDIKVLIIDPNSFGAYLRSIGENRRGIIQESMLFSDLRITSDPLRRLEAAAKNNNTGIKFAFRFYQLPPQMFLLHTDTSSYVEPYYFWASRSMSAYMPVFQFTPQQNPLLHLSMEEHFDLIWERASISSQEFFEQYQVGIDKGIRQSGARNVFSSPALARKRMLWLLQNAKRRVYLQGITLHSFVDDSYPDLFIAIQNLIRSGVEIKMLLLDPESEQAVYRAFCEHHLRTGLPKFADCEPFLTYLKDQQGLMNEPLYQESFTSIQKLNQLAMLAKDCDCFQVKLYHAAPACFILLADDSVMVEQYQYGKIKSSGVSDEVSPILGKDMPVIEFAKYGSIPQPPSELEPYSEGGSFASLQEREAYRLMESHFEFVFKHCARSINDIHLDGLRLPEALPNAAHLQEVRPGSFPA